MSPVASTPTGTTGALIRSDGMVGLIGTADIRVADRDRLGGDADGGAAAVSGPVGLGGRRLGGEADRGTGMDLGEAGGEREPRS